MHPIHRLKIRLAELTKVGEGGDDEDNLPLCHHCDTRLLPQTKRIVQDDIIWCWRCWMRKPVEPESP